MEYSVIDEPARLQELLSPLLEVQRVGIDFEGDGLFRYRPRVCTMQLCADDTPVVPVVVDTLACWDSELLQAFLGPQGPLKVLHDAAFDTRLLWSHGIRLGHIFDTALAARLLGEPATGLSSLLAKRCSVEIQKDQQQADWGRRPLTQKAIRYLHDDVRHLFLLHDSLASDVDRVGIAEELQVECDYVLDQACRPDPPEKPPWLRIKGARRLPPVQRGVLRELAQVRDSAARTWDVPPFRVAHDRELLELARRRPDQLAGLRGIKSLARGRAKSIAQKWLAAIARGVTAGDAPAEELDDQTAGGPSPTERARRKRLERALVAWRTREAQQRGVDVQVVLPGHGLQDLIKHAPADSDALRAIDGLGDVRVDRYGDHWLQLVRQESSSQRGDP